MKHFQTTIEIAAPPEAVWAILTDAAAYAEWDPNMLRMEGTIAAGQQLMIVTELDPNRAFTPNVTVFEPPRKMVWASGMPFGLFSGTRTFTLEPLNGDRTRFHMEEVFDGVLLPLFGGNIPDMNPVFADFSAALKGRAEASA